MSLFGAMNTAISGLTAQSSAFGNISDNVANSQTVGYKRVDTNFSRLPHHQLSARSTIRARWSPAPTTSTTSRARSRRPTTRSAWRSPARASSRSAQPNGQVNGQPIFEPAAILHPRRRLPLDKNGYLVNSAGDYLNGWPVDATTGIGEPQCARADPGDPDGLQPGRHHRYHALGQPAGHAARTGRAPISVRRSRCTTPRHRSTRCR